MSYNDAEEIMESYEKWDLKHARRNFLEKMERKMARKQRIS